VRNKPAPKTLNSSELVHEMRNQLTIVRANVEAFIDGKLVPTTERLEALVQSLRHMDAMLTGLRSQAAMAERARMSQFDVCTLLDENFKSFEALASEKGVKFSVDRCVTKAPECAQFYGDPLAVAQVVDNLVINAVRYTPRGGSVNITCARNAGELEVDVVDTGPGIADEEVAKVFRPGFRGSAAGDDGGSGLGLAVVKRGVEAHGGTVDFRTTATGTTFVVRLPGTPVHSSAEHAARCDHCKAGI
jgi:signal transduction histidine kinase